MIYCVEDDNSIRELMIYTLQSTGFTAKGFAEGGAFWKGVEESLPELVLLDIMLPGEDGISLLKKLKSNPVTRSVPVIMVTARGTEYDKVLGLDNGADDYLTKPFGMMEMVSRVKAVLRRSRPAVFAPTLQAGQIVLNTANHTVTVEGVPVTLTLKEFNLLLTLMENRGMAFTRDQLLSRVWDYEFEGETRTVDVHIRTLRQKLGEWGGLIQTVRGIGYRMGREPDET